MKTILDINYTPFDDERHKLDLFVPEGECRATVMWTHGGGLESGSRKGYEAIGAQLCEAGIGFASVEYRMYPEFAFPAFVEDAAQAASWLKGNAARFGLSEKIIIGGSSAGGYLTMMLCFAREYLGRFGLEPEDFTGYFFNAGQPTTHYNILKYRGEDTRLCRVDEAAPIWYVCDERPGRPIQIVCADGDLPARPEQNQLLMATMRHFGYDMSLVRYKLMEGYGHCAYGGVKKDGRWIMADLIEDFVNFALEKES